MNFENIKKKLQKQFNKNPMDEDIIGRLASAYMETRDFEGAYQVLKYGAEKTKSVQTLSNLGYFYLYEGEPVDNRWVCQEEKAISLLEEAVGLNPVSHAPYSILGEAYLFKNEDRKAEFTLRKAIEIEKTSANLNNLAVALYRQNKFEEARDMFYSSHLKRKLDYYTFRPYLNYGMALAKLGMCKEAITVAEELVNTEKDEFFDIDLIDIISIYYEIKDFNKAMELYPKAFETVSIYPQYFEMYMFALKELCKEDAIDKMYKDIVNSEREIIKEIKENSEIDEECKVYQIREGLSKISKYGSSYNKVRNGEVIENYYEPFIEQDCYLFGCLRHSNPVYSDVVKIKL